MKCPNCGAVYDENCRFCGACGAPLVSEQNGSHRVPILVLILLSVLGLGVYFATGGSDQPRQNVSEYSWFSVADGELYFDPTQYSGGPTLVVPETVDGQIVTAIGAGCFYGCAELTQVQLPDTVEHIGPYAFEDCASLLALDLPDGVTIIATAAFAGCGRLEAVYIPASVDYIGWDVFDGCDSLSFIFYDGTDLEWAALFGQEIDSDPRICYSDGNDWKAD